MSRRELLCEDSKFMPDGSDVIFQMSSRGCRFSSQMSKQGIMLRVPPLCIFLARPDIVTHAATSRPIKGAILHHKTPASHHPVQHRIPASNIERYHAHHRFLVSPAQINRWDLRSIRNVCFGMGQGIQRRGADILNSDWLDDLKKKYGEEKGVLSEGRVTREVVLVNFP